MAQRDGVVGEDIKETISTYQLPLRVLLLPGGGEPSYYLYPVTLPD
ncbi:MAG: hypothetical protein J6C87_03615 [Bacteroides sp.]|nr:hypothetical protein [Bacteroides sp.]